MGGGTLRDRQFDEPLRGSTVRRVVTEFAPDDSPNSVTFPRVAAERTDVPPHPLECGDLVSQAEIALERMPDDEYARKSSHPSAPSR